MVVHSGYPEDVRVYREVRVAQRHGYEVEVVCLREEGQLAEEDVEGVRVTRLPVAHERGGSAVSLVLEYVKFCALATWTMARRAGRDDVVQIHNPPDFLVLAALVPRLRGARVIFDVHDLSSDMFAMRFRGRTARIVERPLRWLERIAALAAHEVVTVHEPYRDELAARGVPKSKIRIVMNTVDEDLLPDGPREPADVFRIVYHGTVTPHYGVNLVLEALAQVRDQIPNARFDVFGGGDAIPALRELADALGVGDLVWFSERAHPQREVLELVQNASVGVIPNLPIPLNRFALSSKLFEYVCLDIPVVCSDLETLHAHFSDDEVLFFEAGNASALANALAQVAADPAAAEARARAARTRYDREYAWGIQSEAYATALG
jgi:glycosyltransferase involved in cell wall biosynthesis